LLLKNGKVKNKIKQAKLLETSFNACHHLSKIGILLEAPRQE
jgi:hypothetical protein